MINNILIINGLYDIICAFSILHFNNNNIFSSIHLNMFVLEEHKNNFLIKRLLAYWILTYGIIRTIIGFYSNKSFYFIASITYFIEALCFE